MSYKITVESELGIIRINFHGTSSTWLVEEAMQELLIIRTREGLTRVLVDHTAASDSIGMLDLLHIGEALAVPAFRDFRLAAFPSFLHAGVEFTSTVACKCGVRFLNFPIEQDARVWLLSN